MAEPLDVIEVLLADHRAIRDLVGQLDATEDAAEQRRLYLRIAELVSAHEAAEETVLYPALRAAAPDVAATVLARLGEHEEVDELLEEMRQLPPSGYAFGKRASALDLDLCRHMDAEEELVFPALREALGREQLVELADGLVAAEAAAPAFHHPHAPA